MRWSPERFHPVVVLPRGYDVLDLTEGPVPESARASRWGVGRYDERRRGVYTAELFSEGARDLHVGVDLEAPPGVAVHAFADGHVHRFGCNPAPGDYGFTVITAHELDEGWIYALHGHLAARSCDALREAMPLRRGDVIGWIGERHENGGWPPHLHFQLAWDAPATHDLPGVVRWAERAESLARFPDPRGVLGPLY